MSWTEALASSWSIGVMLLLLLWLAGSILVPVVISARGVLVHWWSIAAMWVGGLVSFYLALITIYWFTQ